MRKCRKTVTSCPTCRRMYGPQESTSSLAATLIDKVPHKCKYSEYGCEYKDLLTFLVNHEEKCPERTVKCPKCDKMPQLKKYHEHSKEKSCGCYQIKSSKSTTILSKGFMKWDGMKRGTEEEFDIKEVKKILRYYIFCGPSSNMNALLTPCLPSVQISRLIR